ncbi:MAG: hypothetical protein DCC55_17585 [Chloroflexi bacterium]|nr:MAG: hypothetical protein DCC55_17585 [Chloroflexota bacterium]
MNSIYRILTASLLAVLLITMFAVAPVAGQTETVGPMPGTDRETAGPNFTQPVKLSPGDRHWYRFRYVFDEEVDSEPGNAVVSLKMDRVGCASFEVTTSGRLNFPFDDEGEWVGPVGRGTPFNTGDDTIPSHLIWVGSGRFSETHFVIVRHHGDSPCTYTLSITGSPVVF